MQISIQPSSPGQEYHQLLFTAKANEDLDIDLVESDMFRDDESELNKGHEQVDVINLVKQDPQLVEVNANEEEEE